MDLRQMEQIQPEQKYTASFSHSMLLAGINKSNFAWRNRGNFPGSTTDHIQTSNI